MHFVWTVVPLKVKLLGVDGARGGGADMARLSQSVCVQASAWGSTKGSLCIQRHTREHTHKQLLSDLTQQVWLYLFFSRVSPPLPPSPLSFSSQLHLSFLLFAVSSGWIIHVESIVPNGLCTADSNGFVSFGPCVAVVCIGGGVFRHVWVWIIKCRVMETRKMWKPAEEVRDNRWRELAKNINICRFYIGEQVK